MLPMCGRYRIILNHHHCLFTNAPQLLASAIHVLSTSSCTSSRAILAYIIFAISHSACTGKLVVKLGACTSSSAALALGQLPAPPHQNGLPLPWAFVDQLPLRQRWNTAASMHNRSRVVALPDGGLLPACRQMATERWDDQEALLDIRTEETFSP